MTTRARNNKFVISDLRASVALLERELEVRTSQAERLEAALREIHDHAAQGCCRDVTEMAAAALGLGGVLRIAEVEQ